MPEHASCVAVHSSVSLAGDGHAFDQPRRIGHRHRHRFSHWNGGTFRGRKGANCGCPILVPCRCYRWIRIVSEHASCVAVHFSISFTGYRHPLQQGCGRCCRIWRASLFLGILLPRRKLVFGVSPPTHQSLIGPTTLAILKAVSKNILRPFRASEGTSDTRFICGD